MNDAFWRVWIDTGGTFTDCIAASSGGEVRRRKLLSSGVLQARVTSMDGSVVEVEAISGCCAGFLTGFEIRSEGEARRIIEHLQPEQGVERLVLSEALATGLTVEIDAGLEAPVLGLHLLLGIAPGQSLPPLELRLGTTRGTNALLERKGAKCALFVTKGFADLVEIGDQSRSDIFALEIEKPAPLHSRVIEVQERLAADGTVLCELEPADVSSALGKSIAQLETYGMESAAVSLLHGYQNPEHEQRLARGLRTTGIRVSVSSELSGLAGYLARTQTTVVDAYLAPIFGRYIDNISSHLKQRFRVMSSAGGLVDADRFRAKDSLLSGPAGGVVGSLEACRLAGISEAIAFDMGGTSTDVSRISGDVAYDERHEVGGIWIVAPALAIRTVAAGGGSICTATGGRLKVGPESAGADPGPACYGGGGPLTVTDVNLLLGRIDGDRFEVGLDREASQRAFDAQLQDVPGIEAEQLLEGFLLIANERMAETIALVSTRQGFDPKEHSLVAFGGAGGQHACELAGLLGIREVLVPADCSLLSARGIGAAAIERIVQEQVLLDPNDGALDRQIDAAEDRALQLLVEDVSLGGGNVRSQAEVVTSLNLRYRGQDSGLEVTARPLNCVAERFQERYKEVFGAEVDRAIEVEWLRTRARLRAPGLTEGVARFGKESARSVAGWPAIEVWTRGRRLEVPRIERSAMPVPPELPIVGPALITEPFSSTWLPEGWLGFTEAVGGGMILRRGH